MTTNTGKPSARVLAQEQGLALLSQGQRLALPAIGQGVAPTVQEQGLAIHAQGLGLVVPMDLANAQHFMEGLVQVDTPPTLPSSIPSFSSILPHLILTPTHSLITRSFQGRANVPHHS